MRSVGFDYQNTCPEIDKHIGAARHNIASFLSDFLADACPLLPAEAHAKICDAAADRLYRDLEDCFEGARSANEKMRREADRQIEALQDQIAEAEAEIERFQREAA